MPEGLESYYFGLRPLPTYAGPATAPTTTAIEFIGVASSWPKACSRESQTMLHYFGLNDVDYVHSGTPVHMLFTVGVSGRDVSAKFTPQPLNVSTRGQMRFCSLSRAAESKE